MLDRYDAVLFDKDGTLLDFHATWDPAVHRALTTTASADTAAAAADAIGYDLANECFRPDALFLAEPNDVILAALAPHLDVDAFTVALDEFGTATATPATGLPEVLHRLKDAGTTTAVVTNDWESITRDQLRHLGWSDLFAAVVGSDSGFGAKPDAGIVTGTLELLGVAASASALIGDSAHDLVAARAAGVEAVLVTNGAPADPALSALADVVVADLGEWWSSI